MMKKEEDCEKLEEEFISLRVEVDGLNKNMNNSQLLEDKTVLGALVRPHAKKMQLLERASKKN
jgi:hypothetical protein